MGLKPGDNGGTGAAAKEPHSSRIYSDKAHFYDHVFERVFARRIEWVMSNTELGEGTRVLEVGVGTGLSLDAYPATCSVTAMDLSQEMLDYAEQKKVPGQHDHIALRQGDALNLDFPDESFDVVTTFHVITVVPDPHRMLAEMERVCRPGGRVTIINHFSSERALIRGVVNAVDPVTRYLGWSTRLSLNDLFAGSKLRIDRRYKSSATSLFTIVEATKPL
ncbi:MAG: phosphatidylethanolamine/phosphatidyl-N-methylethanolamine N-methyltransferase [Hyphomicrobiaceae bacterium]|jgi:phosphatidylethanolamine/phosphatidyl-N-methylethanolamine N-methyltransferase